MDLTDRGSQPYAPPQSEDLKDAFRFFPRNFIRISLEFWGLSLFGGVLKDVCFFVFVFDSESYEVEKKRAVDVVLCISYGC